MRKHLAIFTKGIGELILSGQKTLEIRLSQAKISPFGVISSHDLVYIKPSGQDPIGQFRVRKVIFYSGLDPEDILEIKRRFGKELAVEESYWQSRSSSRYGTLIFIGECNPFITSPIKFSKRDLRGWVVLN